MGNAFLAGEEPVRRVAKDYPEIAFVLGSEFGPVAPNFSVFDKLIYEPSYLCSVIAGRLARSNILGRVAAIPYKGTFSRKCSFCMAWLCCLALENFESSRFKAFQRAGAV